VRQLDCRLRTPPSFGPTTTHGAILPALTRGQEVAMRLALTVLTTFVLLGCSPENPRRLLLPSSPAAPEPAPSEFSSSAFLLAFVAEDSGICIPDATIEVVAGQARGQRGTQPGPCDVWGYDGFIEFNGLTPGVEMTLRASAPGYTSQERTVVPSSGPQTAMTFVLYRSR
jgi:hypothetical protein